MDALIGPREAHGDTYTGMRSFFVVYIARGNNFLPFLFHFEFEGLIMERRDQAGNGDRPARNEPSITGTQIPYEFQTNPSGDENLAVHLVFFNTGRMKFRSSGQWR